MADPELRISPESRPILKRYAALALRDPRRVELFSFLADAVADPKGVAFEQDDSGLRWTRLEHVAVVWKVDVANSEVDVVDVWDDPSHENL